MIEFHVSPHTWPCPGGLSLLFQAPTGPGQTRMTWTLTTWSSGLRTLGRGNSFSSYSRSGFTPSVGSIPSVTSVTREPSVRILGVTSGCAAAVPVLSVRSTLAPVCLAPVEADIISSIGAPRIASGIPPKAKPIGLSRPIGPSLLNWCLSSRSSGPTGTWWTKSAKRGKRFTSIPLTQE